MARIRCIKPTTPHSKNLAACKREARLCFILLWTLADDVGRLHGDSRLLASLLYPYDREVDESMMEVWLSDLSTNDLIIRYNVNGENYIQITKWLEHQKIDRPTASKLPAPQESSRALASPLELLPRKGREGKGIGEESREDSPQNPPPEKPQHLTPADVAHTFLTETMLTGQRVLSAATDACKVRATATGKSPQVCITEIIAEWKDHLRITDKRFQKSPENFLGQCNKHLSAKAERKLPEPASARIRRQMAEEDAARGIQ